MTDFASSLSDRALPPQNIDAEESILGGILLDPEAMGRVADVLVTEAFYVRAHQDIYRGCLTLHSQGKPTDLMTISSWLQDNALLEKVGGTAKLAQLVDRTVSAVNIDRYAELVMDKYIRRQLIGAGHEIIDLGYDTTKQLINVLDESEQKIFRLTQERPQEGLVSLAETIVQTYNDIEALHQNIALPGIPCGFYDLDAVTSGFQRSDLIIVAGRPSMGKCLAADSQIVLADGSLATIEEIYHNRQAQLLTLGDNWQFQLTRPSAFVDDGIKPVFKVTTRLGRTIETTITHPFLTITGWRKLSELQIGEHIAIPRHIDIFGSEILPESQIKLLAYFIGDGCLTDTSPQFTNSNPRLQQDFEQASLEFPDVKIRYELSNGQRTPQLYISKNLDLIKTNRQIFAQNLRQLLQSQSLPQSKIAELIGVSPSAICLWLQGQCVPQQETFNKLCQVLQIKPELLATDGFDTIAKNNKNSVTLWLEELGIWGKGSYDKFVPEIIFKLQRSQIALFLNRLFATDGWATVLTGGQSQLGYATVSETLARQIQHLLLRFGIIAKLKKRSIKYNNSYQTCWQLDITDAQSIKNFITDIGIFGKEEALSSVQQAMSQRQYKTNCDLIPKQIWEQLAKAKGDSTWQHIAKQAGIKGYSNIHVGKRSLSRERLLQLAYVLEDQNLINLASSAVYWDQIVSIEFVGDKQVYDLTIPNTHNFVANDICVHNTSFALNIAANIAKDHRLPVAIFSLEMSKEQLAQRLLASEAEIESNRLRSGRLAQTDYEPLGKAVGTLSELPIFIDDTANLTVMQMRSQARRLQAEQGGKLGLVLLDYLQLMEGGGDNRVQEISKITRSLKGLARELNVPIIALSQLSRSVESRTNKRPMMSDLRESGSIEQDADLIIMLYRDIYYNPDSPEHDTAEVIITKHRNGPTGTVKLLFQADLTKFRNLARSHSMY